MSIRLFLALALALVVGCGGTHTTSTTPEGGEQASASQALDWESHDQAGLVALVRERATARIHEVEPNLDLEQLPSWVQDPTSAPGLGDRTCEQLLNLAVAEAAGGESDRAIGLINLVRLKANNRNNAYVGSTLLSELQRRSAAMVSNPATEQAAVEAVLGALPFNRLGHATVVFQLFQNQGQLDARVERLHGQLLGLDTATAALYYQSILNTIVAHRPVFLSAIEAVRASHEGAPPQVEYEFPTVDLTGARDAQPVRVAVWDTGVGINLFERQLFTNEAEEANGQDDDGNGVIDDIHGIVADPTVGQSGSTFNPGEQTIAEFAPFMRGVMDLRAGLSSSEAAIRVLALIGEAQDAEALEALSENLDAIGEWGHGTHVAGILLDGLPQAELAFFRSAWAGEARLYHHRGPTDEELAAERQNVEQIAAFINTHHIRVVNASLGFSQDYVEAELRHESERYHTEEEVHARASIIHAARRANWTRVFAACPDTLFVIAAGNSNRNVVEYGDVPASLVHDNLLVVGAVDRFGDWATFTNSNTEQVRIFDFGVGVESFIPNGERVPLSGTSMASPNVANLAGKILSVNPDLNPAAVIELIEETADPIAAPFGGRIANETAALAGARADR